MKKYYLAKLKTGNNPLRQPVDPKIFSLTDLSFLTRILNSIGLVELIDDENTTIEQILDSKGRQILVDSQIQIDQTFLDFNRKITAVGI
ncbi:unnamed protein product [Meloidogyne enterolobii]|uniref:Uncharacterized protein n=1 Tax=Meloidogyne enterolobii TaxID=390850 RepID=A0ACB0YH29_MELEN